MIHYTDTLTVDLDCPHTILGSRPAALAHFKEHGRALWIRANGRAVLFYRDPDTGRRRQRTWYNTTIRRSP